MTPGLIFFGTRSVTMSYKKGDYVCPDCGPTQYNWKRQRRFFTLYFIPLIPLDLLNEYVECQGCKSTWDTSILDSQGAIES